MPGIFQKPQSTQGTYDASWLFNALGSDARRLGQALVSGVAAPSNILFADPSVAIDQNSGSVSRFTPQMIGDALNTASMVSLGSPGGVPADALGMGMKVYHGSPVQGLTHLLPSERGPLGSGVYATPLDTLAHRYAGESGKTYSFEAPDELFHGDKFGLGSDINPYELWREQGARLSEAAPADKREQVSALFEKLWPGDGYPLFGRLANLLGGKDKAKDLFRRAGFKGISGFVDGPEVNIFDPVTLPPPGTSKLSM